MNEILARIYDSLVNAPSMAGIAVFDHVPQDYSSYPYVRMSVINQSDEGTETEIKAFTLRIQLSVFSQKRVSSRYQRFKRKYMISYTERTLATLQHIVSVSTSKLSK